MLVGIMVLSVLLTSLMGFAKANERNAFASNQEDYKTFEAYYEIEFVDQTSDHAFTKTGDEEKESKIFQDFDFKLNLRRSFKLDDGTVIDQDKLIFTKEDLDKVNGLEHLTYRTKEKYPYYDTKNNNVEAFIAIFSGREFDNYYAGDVRVQELTRKVNGEDAKVFVLSTPILNLSRNIQKTKVGYEGELTEESKDEIIENFKKANPNMTSLKDYRFEENKLIIETWDRHHTKTPHFEISLEDLIVREIPREEDQKINEEVIAELENRTEELAKEIDQVKRALEDAQVISSEQKGKIESLEKEKAGLQEALDKAQKQVEESKKSEDSKDNQKTLEKLKNLEEKVQKLEKTLAETNGLAKKKTEENTKQSDGELKTFSTNTVKAQEKGQVQEEETSKAEVNTNRLNEERPEQSNQESQNQEKSVRYPNKLTPKDPVNSQSDGSSQETNINTGDPTNPYKSRGTVTENVDNANNDFPIHRGEDSVNSEIDLPYYSADARQFVSFTTKSGKTFHLIINHDEDSENVMLLTEVSEDDLLNMVETKEEPVKEEPVKIEEPEPVVEEPVKQEESSNAGTYLLVGLVIAVVLGAGYYFKVVKARENDELADFEEDDEDYYYSEAEDDYLDSDEDEYDDEEEDIDSEDLL